jgi:hypothetical protein
MERVGKMAAVENVADTEDQSAESERDRSTIPFPYADLDNAIRIAKAVSEVGGTTCQVAGVAAKLGVKITGGGFRQMLSAAKVFGLVTFGQSMVQLTVLGQKIADPKQEKQARVDAFLTVPLYRAIFDRVKGAGGTLPPPAGLESEMVSLGVTPKVVDRARQTFQRSALQAGFFAFGQDRLIMPSHRPAEGGAAQSHGGGKPGGDSGGGGGGNTRDPLLQGLINKLPPDGTTWGAEDRVAWMELAKGIFDFVYGKAEPITVGLAKDSAKENAR